MFISQARHTRLARLNRPHHAFCLNTSSIRCHSASKVVDPQVESLLAKPSWSVRSLLPDKNVKESADTITPKQLHHLLRLSALPRPTSQQEEDAMLETLESQIHFVREIQRVDTTGVEPLQSIRDESADAIRESTIGLSHLQDAMSKEKVIGRRRKIQRQPGQKNERPDGTAWDGNALRHASKTMGRFFVTESAN